MSLTIPSFFSAEDKRSQKVKKNIIASTIIKVVDGVTNLLIVPVTLGYLSSYEYGVWLVLSSILSWINTFDIGLGNGLRNKLTESLAKGDQEASRKYVTTTMFVLIVIVVVLICVFSPLIMWMNWYSALNVEESIVPNLRSIVYTAFVLFCFNFAFKFIGNVYQALQLPAISNLIGFLGRFVALAAIFICSKIIKGNLLIVSIIYSASPLLVCIAFYPITFKTLYPFLSPSLKCFDRSCIKDLLSLSVLFFLLQLGGLVLFAMSNFMISKWFGPDEVTPYNISYQYFSLALVVFSLLITPLWSAVTDAFAKGEMEWIKNTHLKVKKLLLFIGALLLVMLFASSFVYHIWVGDGISVPFHMSALLALYVYITLWSVGYSYFLNGMNKLKIQAINTITMAILFYPVCFFLSKPFGVNGIIIGMCLLNIPGAVFNYIQFNKLIGRKATGLWAQ